MNIHFYGLLHRIKGSMEISVFSALRTKREVNENVRKLADIRRVIPLYVGSGVFFLRSFSCYFNIAIESQKEANKTRERKNANKKFIALRFWALCVEFVLRKAV